MTALTGRITSTTTDLAFVRGLLWAPSAPSSSLPRSSPRSGWPASSPSQPRPATAARRPFRSTRTIRSFAPVESGSSETSLPQPSARLCGLGSPGAFPCHAPFNQRRTDVRIAGKPARLAPRCRRLTASSPRAR